MPLALRTAQGRRMLQNFAEPLRGLGFATAKRKTTMDNFVQYKTTYKARLHIAVEIRQIETN